MQSRAKTVDQYLAELPDDRRRAIEAVRRVILENLDADYEEGMQYGMIGYYVPHRVYPPGYHCDPKQPLPYAALASQKNYMSLYLMSVYAEGEQLEWFQREWKKAGKKLDMGKCCVRFKSLDDVALEVVAEAIRRVSAKAHVAHYEAAVRPKDATAKPKAAKAKAASKPKRTTKTK